MTTDHSLPTRLCDRPTLPSPGSGSVTLEQVASLITTPMGRSASVDATLRDASRPPSVSGLLIETRSVGAVGAAGDLPQYEPIELLGSGGMGAVVAARQNCLGRRVALKRIRSELVGDERLHQQFLSEAALTAQLVHPNIPQIYEMGLDGEGTPFYTMQEITGRRWEDFLQRPVTGQEPVAPTPAADGPTTLDDHLAIFLQVCNAIGFAHSRGIIHRDIKPANVMLGPFGQVYVMDWGLAAGLPGRVSLAPDGRCIADPLSPETAMGGTPAYMAPEMARALYRDIGERSDVYLLGAVLFRILTGAPPHDGSLIKDCLHEAANNRIRSSPVTGELMTIARRAMATLPADRYPDVPACARPYKKRSAIVKAAPWPHAPASS